MRVQRTGEHRVVRVGAFYGLGCMGCFPQLVLRYLCKARWVPSSYSTRVVTPPRRRGPGPELVIPIVLHGGSFSVPSELCSKSPSFVYATGIDPPPHCHAESSHLTERIDCSKSLYEGQIWRHVCGVMSQLGHPRPCPTPLAAGPRCAAAVPLPMPFAVTSALRSHGSTGVLTRTRSVCLPSCHHSQLPGAPRRR